MDVQQLREWPEGRIQAHSFVAEVIDRLEKKRSILCRIS